MILYILIPGTRHKLDYSQHEKYEILCRLPSSTTIYYCYEQKGKPSSKDHKDDQFFNICCGLRQYLSASRNIIIKEIIKDDNLEI